VILKTRLIAHDIRMFRMDIGFSAFDHANQRVGSAAHPLARLVTRPSLSFHPQGVGRACPLKGEAVVVKPMNRQQPRSKAAEAATTALVVAGSILPHLHFAAAICPDAPSGASNRGF